MRYAILTDIHANFSALQAVIADLKEDARIMVLGDLFGYGPAVQAAKCLNWLRFSHGAEEFWLPGNHDECMVEQLCQSSKDATVTLAVQRSYLEQDAYRDDLEWFLKKVTDSIQTSINPETGLEEETNSVIWNKFDESASSPALTLAFTHASLDVKTRRLLSLYPWEKELLRNELRTLKNMSATPMACVVHGHTHFPCFANLDNLGNFKLVSIRYGVPLRLPDGYSLVCPGSLGQPRDGDPRAAYALIDPEERTVEFRRVKYDVDAVIRDLKKERDDPKTRSVLTAKKVRLEFAGLDNQTIRYNSHFHLAVEAYRTLTDRLPNGSGGNYENSYHSKAYKTPEWDLEALD